MAQSSFYGDTPNYATAYPTQNDSNTQPVNGNTAAPSSFYPNGGVFEKLADSDTVIAQMTALEAQAAADAAAAANSATGAASSATAASGSASAAAGSASAASTSATNAANSATAASGSATAASGSATAASGSATSASGSASTATTQAGNASTSATNAANSATAAAGSATAAASSLAAMAPSSATPLMDGTAAPGSSTNFARGDHVHPTDTSRAPLASPAFTGTPTAPTASALDNSTKLATTAYADSAVSTLSGATTTALLSKAPLASPALTGTPTAPTATVGTNTTQLATTAFVLANAPSVAAANPSAPIGLTAVNGTAATFMRSDGAPALSQAITPTWTGTHTFNNATASALHAGPIGINQASPVCPIHIGTPTVSNNDSDPQVMVARNVDNGTAGNAHCFADSSYITRTGTIGYNSFDTRFTVAGSANYDHFAGFQAIPVIGTSGTTLAFYGTAIQSVVNTGIITNAYCHYAFDGGGTGTITNQYGYYCEGLAKGSTLNYAYFSAGTVPSKFGGNLDVGGLSVAGTDVTGPWTSWTPTITSSGGTITTSSSKSWYKKIGKTVHIATNILITNNGTGTGFVQFTLPFTTATHANNVAASFAGLKSGCLALVAVSGAGTSTVSVATYAGLYPASNGDELYLSGTYETD